MRARVDLGKGRESAFEIINGRKQRLRLLAALACDKADAPALGPAIEKIDGTRRVLAGDFQPGHLIAKIERKIEGYFAVQPSTRADIEGRGRQYFAPRGHGGNLSARGRLGLGLVYAGMDPVRRPRFCNGKSARARGVAVNVDGSAEGSALNALPKAAAPASPTPSDEPRHADLAALGTKLLLDLLSRGGTIAGKGLRRQRCETLPEIRRGQRGKRRGQAPPWARDKAFARPPPRGMKLLGERLPLGPAACGRPAIVHRHNERLRHRRRAADRGFMTGTGQGGDDARRR